MPELSASELLVVAVIGIVIGLVGLIVAFMALGRSSKLNRQYAILQGSERGESIAQIVETQIGEVASMRLQLEEFEQVLRQTRGRLRTALRHVAVVRYNAFTGMGGAMSFSAAFLDDNADGLVLTTIHGRSESRIYAKEIRDGHSDTALSPEEIEAVESAQAHVERRNRRGER